MKKSNEIFKNGGYMSNMQLHFYLTGWDKMGVK